jgi:hypothetical protein
VLPLDAGAPTRRRRARELDLDPDLAFAMRALAGADLEPELLVLRPNGVSRAS